MGAERVGEVAPGLEPNPRDSGNASCITSVHVLPSMVSEAATSQAM